MVKKLIVFTLLCGLMRMSKYICIVIPSFDLLCGIDVIELKKEVLTSSPCWRLSLSPPDGVRTRLAESLLVPICLESEEKN